MAFNTTKTLWNLDAQPLPGTEVRDPVFVTVWLFACIIFAAILYRFLDRKENPTWTEFRTIMLGTSFLAFWYLIAVIDRWIHYDLRSVVYGYILLAPVWESSRVTSTVLLLWGTYTVVWKELENRFTPREQGRWWFAARVALFVVSLMSIFYVALYIALSVVWMEFFSLNVIADIASKRTAFEIAMTAFFFAFGLLTLVEATYALIIRAVTVHGHIEATRLTLWLAAFFLFVRSCAEFGIILHVYTTDATRQSTKLTTDITYGLLTFLYLITMCWMARVAASSFDSGGRQAQLVASDIRHHILSSLHHVTNGARRQAPAFETMLQDVETNIDRVLSNGPLSGTLQMRHEHKRSAATDCINQLRTEFGALDPKHIQDRSSSRTASGLSSFFARQSASAQKLLRMKGSSSTLQVNRTRPPGPAGSGSDVTGTSAARVTSGATTLREEVDQDRHYGGNGYGPSLPTFSSPPPSLPRPVSGSYTARSTNSLNTPPTTAAPGPSNTAPTSIGSSYPSLPAPARWAPSLPTSHEPPEPSNGVAYERPSFSHSPYSAPAGIERPAAPGRMSSAPSSTITPIGLRPVAPPASAIASSTGISSNNYAPSRSPWEPSTRSQSQIAESTTAARTAAAYRAASPTMSSSSAAAAAIELRPIAPPAPAAFSTDPTSSRAQQSASESPYSRYVYPASSPSSQIDIARPVAPPFSVPDPRSASSSPSPVPAWPSYSSARTASPGLPPLLQSEAQSPPGSPLSREIRALGNRGGSSTSSLSPVADPRPIAPPGSPSASTSRGPTEYQHTSPYTSSSSTPPTARQRPTGYTPRVSSNLAAASSTSPPPGTEYGSSRRGSTQDGSNAGQPFFRRSRRD